MRFVGVDSNDPRATMLNFEVPEFGDVAEEFFAQPGFWDEGFPSPRDTAFELFGAALRDVSERRTDSIRYDPGLLQRILKYGQPLRRGVRRIELLDTRLDKPGHIDSSVVESAGELYQVTPEPRRIRVTGRLDLMGASQGVLKVHVRPGEVVTALWDGGASIDTLREYFNEDVVVEGIGVFRPSGALLRVEADAIAIASTQDEFFRTLPVASVRRDFSRALRQRRGEVLGYGGILQSIPAGEESDEDFVIAVEQLS